MLTSSLPVTAIGRVRWSSSSLDAAVASVLLILLAPVLALIGLWVALESHGPATLQRAIAGRDGRLMYVTDYRTFRVRSDTAEFYGATMIGRILNATGLRRLPRLLDIKAGRMSLADAFRN